MSAIKFEINGQLVSPDSASWYYFAPCGCGFGVTLAIRCDEVLATEEQAWRELEPNRVQRERKQAAGFTMRLDLRAKVHDLLVDKCPHTPRWGVAPTPLPGGHDWARDDGYPRKGTRKHIVPGDYTAGVAWGGMPVAALCGSKTSCWSSRWPVLDGIPECVRCQRAAQKTAAALPEPTKEA